jgi:phage shock protein A
MTPEQAKAIRESATNIIAHEKLLESERSTLTAELDKARKNARQAVLMADEASQAGETDKASEFNESAQVMAEHIVTLEAQLATIDSELVAARDASAEARSVASDSAIKMAQMKARGAELRADLYRAAVAEATLEADGTPSFDEVKDTIGHRLAKAEAVAELSEVDNTAIIDHHAAEIEEAARAAKAQARLAQIKSQMGVGSTDSRTDDSIVDDADDPDDTPTD